MLVSIIIPTFKRHDLLLRTLTAVCLQHFPMDEYEVVVADDAVCDETRDLVSAMSDSSRCALRYVPVLGNHGPAAARNCGWREARGEILAFTDDDCIPDTLWLANGIRGLQQDESQDAVWGKLIAPEGTSSVYEKDKPLRAEAIFATANCFVKREAMAIVGGFDEQFRVAWREDTDLYFRLLEYRMRVEHVPSAIVVHLERPARWGASLWQQARSQFDVLLYRKHPRLYRQHIPPFPFLYVAIVTCCLGAVVAYVLGLADVSLLFGVLWLGLTMRFAYQRLKGTSFQFSSLLEMLVTSIAIPWLAIFYRVVGWCRLTLT